MDEQEFQDYMTELELLALDLLESEVEQGNYQQARDMLNNIGIKL